MVSSMLLRKKTWLKAQHQIEKQRTIISQLHQALSLVPIEQIERGDLWLPSARTISTIKHLNLNLENLNHDNR